MPFSWTMYSVVVFYGHIVKSSMKVTAELEKMTFKNVHIGNFITVVFSFS